MFYMYILDIYIKKQTVLMKIHGDHGPETLLIR